MTRQEIIVQLAASLLANSYSQEVPEHYIKQVLGLGGNESYKSKLHYPIFIAKQAVMYADALLEELHSEENAQKFCSKAELFVKWLDANSYESFWSDTGMKYHHSRKRDSDMSCSEIVSLFKEIDKD
jgi:hypothetical protein